LIASFLVCAVVHEQRHHSSFLLSESGGSLTMRPTLRTLLSICIAVACGSPTSGQDSGFGWWPFRSGDAAETTVKSPSQVSTGSRSTPAPNATSHESGSPEGLGGAPPTDGATLPPGTLEQNNWNNQADRPWLPWGGAMPKLPMPSFQKPEVSVPRPRLPFLPGKSEAEQARNTWLEKNADHKEPSPWQSAADGARKVRQSTRNAWRKTIDVMTPWDSSEPPEKARVARRDDQPSFWSQVMPGKAEKEPEGPRTVTEWMGQERLKP
jgi:hypothetical protein